MAMYNGMGQGVVASDMDALARTSAPPKQMIADNGYEAAAESARTVGVVEVG